MCRKAIDNAAGAQGYAELHPELVNVVLKSGANDWPAMALVAEIIMAEAEIKALPGRRL